MFERKKLPGRGAQIAVTAVPASEIQLAGGIGIQEDAFLRLAGEVNELWQARADLSEMRAIVRRIRAQIGVHFRDEERSRSAMPQSDRRVLEQRILLRQLDAIENELAQSACGKPGSDPARAVMGFVMGLAIGRILRDAAGGEARQPDGEGGKLGIETVS